MKLHCFLCDSPLFPDDQLRDQELHLRYLEPSIPKPFHGNQVWPNRQNNLEPRNRSWITKVRASSWRTSQNSKLSHHHRGDHDFLYFTMHTNI